MRSPAAIVLAVLVVACAGAPAGPLHPVTGRALAGPVCPVERQPPDPACAPRPVAGAVIVLVAADGGRVEARTGADGSFRAEVAAGRYELTAQPVEGLMGVPPPLVVEVDGPVDVGVLAYDTGIR